MLNSIRTENRENWKLVDQFDSSYWSGLDASYYLDNIKLEECVQVNYQIIERVQPYYGYASYTADVIHHGNRLITGDISLNMKRDGYMFSFLRLVRQNQTKTAPQRPAPKKTQTQSAEIGLLGATGGLGVTAGYSIDTVASLIKALENPDTAENFVNSAKQNQLNESTINQVEPKTQIQPGVSIFQTLPQGFSLMILLGTELAEGKTLRIDNTGNYIRDGAIFDIPDSVKYDLPAAPAHYLPGSGIKIIGVEITGIARNQGDDGRSIIETYQFMAKDVRLVDRTGKLH